MANIDDLPAWLVAMVKNTVPDRVMDVLTLNF